MIPTMRFLAVVAILVLGAATQAATLQVPHEYPTLEAAFAAAESGDVVELYPGVHAVTDLTVPVELVIRGVGPDASAVVLDGGRRGRILTVLHLNATVWIQNLTFRGGFANGESANLMSGGALFVSNSAVGVQNCRFEDNEARAHGGAIRSVDSILHISQCDFVGNVARYGGGAIDASYDADPIFRRCRFEDNTASWGGAVSCRGGAAPDFVGCDFVANTAGGFLGYGGAVFADHEGAPSFDACTFYDNLARLGGAVACFQESDVTVVRSTFVSNASFETGGGFFCLDGSPRIEASIIAYQEGTGITSEASALPDVACTGVWNNSGGDVDGALGSADFLLVDPGFCNPTGAGTARFALTAGSALAPGNAACPTVGAWPVGCDAVLPDIAAFDAQLAGTMLSVSWSADGDAAHDRYRLTWSQGDVEHEILVYHREDGFYTAHTALPPEVGNNFVLQLYARGSDETWEPLLGPDVGNDEPDDSEPPAAPSQLDVRNWPNPFNPTTTIAFDLPRDQYVRIGIYGPDGRRVATIYDAWTLAGTTEVPWNGRDASGRQVASGMYIVRVQADQGLTSHKISLLK